MLIEVKHLTSATGIKDWATYHIFFFYIKHFFTDILRYFPGSFLGNVRDEKPLFIIDINIYV